MIIHDDINGHYLKFEYTQTIFYDYYLTLSIKFIGVVKNFLANNTISKQTISRADWLKKNGA